MPKNLEHMELRPKGQAFCLFCGIQWKAKEDPKPPADPLSIDLKFGIWEVLGFQAIYRGGRKNSIKICNDCLTLLRIAAKPITDIHLEWLRQEIERSEGGGGPPRISIIGMSLLEATKVPEGRGGAKIVCNMSDTCSMEDCGGKTPHYKVDCEPCPFDKNAICLPIESEIQEV